jgi:N-acetylglutamate synthase-like GNAT family acetyltransferase
MQEDIVFRIATPTSSDMQKYLGIVCDVFYKTKPNVLKENLEKLDENTRFYVFEKDNLFISSLFIHPIMIDSVMVGGIGGVVTRLNHRGKGYGKTLLKKVISDSRGSYDALLLWTKVFQYFNGFGFQDITQYFQEDPNGSTPMMYFNKPEAEVLSRFSEKLPRRYF